MQTNTEKSAQEENSIQPWIEQAMDPASFVGVDATSVAVRETHISWVFLVGDCAFKVKKPIQTPFLDYSTLELRKHFCEEELRLDRRYTSELYLDVVPIQLEGDRLVIGASEVDRDERIIDYAVKMRRFDERALLSNQLDSAELTRQDIRDLATRVAQFHHSAERYNPLQGIEAVGTARGVYDDAIENFTELEQLLPQTNATLKRLKKWTTEYFQRHRMQFEGRLRAGFIRECHGDLHLANIVEFEGAFVPFDGIEFNDRFRWIDTISDAAFSAMDFAAHGRTDFCYAFINSYLDETGDHASLAMMRWYLVYRSLVRAKVAALRLQQPGLSKLDESDIHGDCDNHIDLAHTFSQASEPRLWITHGVSGSGKTYASERIVEQFGAIRLRSDVERKRHFGFSPRYRPSAAQKQLMYGESASRATYARLRRMARCILRSGYPVIVDATFLHRSDREAFRTLAEHEQAAFSIVDCQTDVETSRGRIERRSQQDDDASDANLSVLAHQLETEEPLTAEERKHVIDF